MTEPFKPGTAPVPGFPRITHNPRVMGGKACIRGMRVTVSMILGNLGAGTTIDELLASYDYIEREDVMECLRYAPGSRRSARSCSSPLLEDRDRHEHRQGLDRVSEDRRASGVHWSSVGDPAGDDGEIMLWAAGNDHVVLTADLDFGTLLAASNARGRASSIACTQYTRVFLRPEGS